MSLLRRWTPVAWTAKARSSGRPAQAERACWWLGPAPAATQGLDSAQAQQALDRHGPNSFYEHLSRPPLLQFLARFRNPLVLILLAASAVSAAMGDASNFLIIISMVLLSVLLDFVQEHRAGRAAQRLRESVALRAMVVRDGHPRDVAVGAIVPDDVVILSVGNRVPADGRVLEARDFFVNESLLTGEAYPVEKRAGTVADDAKELHQARNAVFMGSTVLSGSARMLVAATGKSTMLGEVAHRVLADAPPTAFEIATHRFGLMIMRITLLLVLFVLMANVLQQRPLLDSFLFAVALAVGLTPELLPMVVSVTLSRGALRMARRRVIVKRLAAIQNLGAMDVLCTDKTGTLTEARIRVERCVDPRGNPGSRVLMLAHLNSAFESGIRSPLDEALLAAGLDTSAWNKLDEVPFDFERRRVSVLVESGALRLLVVKGAPEDVLDLCSSVEGGDATGRVALDEAEHARLTDLCRRIEGEGLRVLAVASREVDASHNHADVRDERELSFAGFVAFMDPPKHSARAALAALATSGVQVKMVSGDSELVCQHVAALLGMSVAGTLTGREIAGMDDAALRAAVERTSLFCRVNPAQKNRIILALKARGHVVGYIGDGVNDAPPLRSADVGLTVAGAADVAREVADMVLLEQDLSVLHEGVLEGRRTHGNVMKYIMMGTSSNFGNMLSLAGAAAILPFMPLMPTQILLNNVLYDLSQTTIPFDRVDEADLRKPRSLDLRLIRRFMMVFGAISSGFDAFTFYLLLKVLHADVGQFRSGWFIESLASQVLVIFVIRTRGRPWASRPAVPLVLVSLLVVMAAVALPWTPLGGTFQLPVPPLAFFPWLAGLLACYLLLAEAMKRLFFRRLAGTPERTG